MRKQNSFFAPSIVSPLIPHGARLTAFVVIVLLYGLTRLPQLSADMRTQIAGRFAFHAEVLPTLPGTPNRIVRAVHPDLDRIQSWISSVGASVAINDLDGDGLANDICYVDTRADQVVITPAPVSSTGTASESDSQLRYEPFVLNPVPLRYDETMAPMGCLPGDLNEDGRMDLLVYYWGRTPIAFLQRDSEPMAGVELAATVYYPQEIVPGGERWFTNAASFADLDGDSHMDLIIGNYFQDGARILDPAATDRASMQHSMSRAFNGGHNRILLWTDATASTEQGVEPGVIFSDASDVLDEETAGGWTLALGAADLDGDLLPEIYFANDFGPDRLLHNRSAPGKLAFAQLVGRKGWTTPNSKIVGHDSFKGMGVDFGDLNDDGLLDIYVSNIAAEYSLEESHFLYLSTGTTEQMVEQMEKGIAPYVDRSEPLGLARSGWGWETRLADFDNDGTLEALQATGFVKGETDRWPELHELAMGNDELLKLPTSWPLFRPGDDLSGHQHNPFFVRADDGRFHDIAPELGLDAPQVTRGIATADVDGDGDLDFAVGNQWESSYFYRNDCPACSPSLGLHLRLPIDPSETTVIRQGHPRADMPSRPAIGATAIVHLPDGRRLTAQVDGGNGHSGERSPDLHFGVGDVDPATPLVVEVAWRTEDGSVHEQQMELTPGWHTVWLASQ